MWRVSYIRDTGEVYAVRVGGPVKLLGQVDPDPEGCYYATLDRVLAGWADQPVKRLSWVKGRLNDRPRIEEARDPRPTPDDAGSARRTGSRASAAAGRTPTRPRCARPRPTGTSRSTRRRAANTTRSSSRGSAARRRGRRQSVEHHDQAHAAEGTLVEGTARGDGSADDAEGPAGSSGPATWAPGTSRIRRDQQAQRGRIDGAADALREAGFEVDVEVDDSDAGRSPRPRPSGTSGPRTGPTGSSGYAEGAAGRSHAAWERSKRDRGPVRVRAADPRRPPLGTPGPRRPGEDAHGDEPVGRRGPEGRALG